MTNLTFPKQLTADHNKILRYNLMTRQPNVLTDTENAPFSGSDSGYSQGSIVVRFRFQNFKLIISFSRFYQIHHP